LESVGEFLVIRRPIFKNVQDIVGVQGSVDRGETRSSTTVIDELSFGRSPADCCQPLIGPPPAKATSKKSRRRDDSRADQFARLGPSGACGQTRLPKLRSSSVGSPLGFEILWTPASGGRAIDLAGKTIRPTGLAQVRVLLAVDVPIGFCCVLCRTATERTPVRPGVGQS